MTENNRYIEINNELCNYIKDTKTFVKYDFNEICDLLNMQDNRIKELEKENEDLRKGIITNCIIGDVE